LLLLDTFTLTTTSSTGYTTIQTGAYWTNAKAITYPIVFIDTRYSFNGIIDNGSTWVSAIYNPSTTGCNLGVQRQNNSAASNVAFRLELKGSWK